MCFTSTSHVWFARALGGATVVTEQTCAWQSLYWGKLKSKNIFFWFKGVKVISCIICTTPGLQNKTKFEFILHDRKTDQHTAAGLGFIS